jgi:rRNA maturation protein Nop10
MKATEETAAGSTCGSRSLGDEPQWFSEADKIGAYRQARDISGSTSVD